jgi:hypothetical protein
MKSFTEPAILTGEERLEEIYKLRCLAWENSPNPGSINFTKYPKGFFDHLDKKSIHFFSVNERNEIIAASRITIVNAFEELPYPAIFKMYKSWPSERPFLFFSRLVIHPGYRKMGLKEKMDKIRLKYQTENRVAFSVMTGSERRAHELAAHGFKTVATVSREIDPTFPFEHRELLLFKQNI